MSFERRITDERVLRGLSHPLRLRLLELLETEGPLTATQAATQLGTTPSNCSFHLRLLARHGFVEEAPRGTGRQRPWRAVDQTNRVKVDELDPAGRLAVRELLEVMAERYRQNVLTWLRTRDRYPAAWRDAAGETHSVLYLTASELAALNEQLHEVVAPYADRTRAERPPGGAPVAITLSTLPLRPPDHHREGASDAPVS